MILSPFTTSFLLALGMAFTTASQLRPEILKIGPGEAFLVAWLLAMLARRAASPQPRVSFALGVMLSFWLLFAGAQSLGSLTGYLIGDTHDPDLFRHDIIAYLLLAAVSLMSVTETSAGDELRLSAWFVVGLSALSLAGQLADGYALFSLPNTDPWFWDRLRGWSENPNQLALFCLIIVFLSFYLAENQAGVSVKITALAAATLAMVAGRLSKSDTFSLGLAAGALILIALQFRSWLTSGGRRGRLSFAFASLSLPAVPLLIAAAAPLAYSAGFSFDDFARTLSKNNQQEHDGEAQLRFAIWGQAFDRGLASGMLGLGPGPHLDIPPSIIVARQEEIEPKYIEHPAVNRTPNFEAHNTTLDLWTQGGFLSVLAFGGITAIAGITAFRRNQNGLVALIGGLVIFSVFHLIVRQPLYWFSIALCLTAPARIPRSAPNRARG